MKNTFQKSLKVTLLLSFFYTIGLSNTFGQNATSEKDCIMMTVSYLDNNVYFFYGNDRIETISMKPVEKMAMLEQYYFKQNIVINAVNKLRNQGYKICTSNDLTNTVSGSVGTILFFCKD